jgi:hypothetical protein
LREKAPGQLVSTVGDADRHLPGGTPIELGRASRPRSPASWGAAILDVKEPVIHQLVQMELGGVESHIGPRRRLFSAHRLGLPHHESVEGPTHRFGQNGDAGHPRVKVV